VNGSGPQPAIGVVLIFLNAKPFLAEAIESVRAQSFEDWELVLVDDGSTDGSTVVAKDYAERFAPKIRYVEHDGHRNLGMSASRNRGARETGAPFLAFIDADDVWMPAKLAEQMEILAAHPQAALVLGALLYWQSWQKGASRKSDRLLLTAGAAGRQLSPPRAFLAADPVGLYPGAGVDFLARRAAFDDVGGFEDHFRGLYEDQAFFAKIFLAATVFISGKSWLKYRQHPHSCMSVAAGDGTSGRERERYFDWLTRYAEGRHASAGILRALERARRPTVMRRVGCRLAKAVSRRRIPH